MPSVILNIQIFSRNEGEFGKKVEMVIDSFLGIEESKKEFFLIF